MFDYESDTIYFDSLPLSRSLTPPAARPSTSQSASSTASRSSRYTTASAASTSSTATSHYGTPEIYISGDNDNLPTERRYLTLVPDPITDLGPGPSKPGFAHARERTYTVMYGPYSSDIVLDVGHSQVSRSPSPSPSPSPIETITDSHINTQPISDPNVDDTNAKSTSAMLSTSTLNSCTSSNTDLAQTLPQDVLDMFPSPPPSPPINSPGSPGLCGQGHRMSVISKRHSSDLASRGMGSLNDPTMLGVPRLAELKSAQSSLWLRRDVKPVERSASLTSRSNKNRTIIAFDAEDLLVNRLPRGRSRRVGGHEVRMGDSYSDGARTPPGEKHDSGLLTRRRLRGQPSTWSLPDADSSSMRKLRLDFTHKPSALSQSSASSEDQKTPEGEDIQLDSELHSLFEFEPTPLMLLPRIPSFESLSSISIPSSSPRSLLSRRSSGTSVSSVEPEPRVQEEQEGKQQQEQEPEAEELKMQPLTDDVEPSEAPSVAGKDIEVEQADPAHVRFSSAPDHVHEPAVPNSSASASSSHEHLSESAFSTNAIPAPAETSAACALSVFDEKGRKVLFGSIIAGNDALSTTPTPSKGRRGSSPKTVKTIVCFIRHFLCPLCQDYMFSISRTVDPEVLAHAGVRLVVIGNGAWEMIKSYRRIFRFPFPVYTDPKAELYTALGMTMRTLDPGPKVPSSSSSSGSSLSLSRFSSPGPSLSTTPSSTHLRTSYSTVPSRPTSLNKPLPPIPTTRPFAPSSAAPQSYVRHRKLWSGISHVLKNAVKARMPVWRYMGDKALLGGEFVFEWDPLSGVYNDPLEGGKEKKEIRGLECLWAHRMRYTTGHEEIGSVIGHGIGEQSDGAETNMDEDMGMCGDMESDGCSVRGHPVASMVAMSSLSSLVSLAAETHEAVGSSRLAPRSIVSEVPPPSPSTTRSGWSAIESTSICGSQESGASSVQSAWLKQRTRAMNLLREKKSRRRLIGSEDTMVDEGDESENGEDMDAHSVAETEKETDTETITDVRITSPVEPAVCEASCVDANSDDDEEVMIRYYSEIVAQVLDQEDEGAQKK